MLLKLNLPDFESFLDLSKCKAKRQFLFSEKKEIKSHFWLIVFPTPNISKGATEIAEVTVCASLKLTTYWGGLSSLASLTTSPSPVFRPCFWTVKREELAGISTTDICWWAEALWCIVTRIKLRKLGQSNQMFPQTLSKYFTYICSSYECHCRELSVCFCVKVEVGGV